MIGSTIFMLVESCSRSFASWVAPSRFASVEYAFSIERPLGDRRDVLLVVLAEIGRERVRDRALLAHPRERAARIEAAGERDPDPLADRQRVEDHAAVVHDSRPRWWRNRSSRSAPVVPS